MEGAELNDINLQQRPAQGPLTMDNGLDLTEEELAEAQQFRGRVVHEKPTTDLDALAVSLLIANLMI
ncbi:hypothetical protein LTR66_016660, partial [Elasticomyces elasticus]